MSKENYINNTTQWMRTFRQIAEVKSEGSQSLLSKRISRGSLQSGQDASSSTDTGAHPKLQSIPPRTKILSLAGFTLLQYRTKILSSRLTQCTLLLYRTTPCKAIARPMYAEASPHMKGGGFTLHPIPHNTPSICPTSSLPRNIHSAQILLEGAQNGEKFQ